MDNIWQVKINHNTGAFGDWPEDFAAVALDSEGRYLDAAQARLLEGEAGNSSIKANSVGQPLYR